MNIIIGSRGSKLALAQSRLVINKLKQAYPMHDYEIKVIKTRGDRILDRPLDQIGEKGVFTQEIENALLSGEIDLAVHSMKDMPSVCGEGLMFVGTILAEDNRDCLILNHGLTRLEDLPSGARIGTGSKRRAFQLKKLRDDLEIVNIRGNVETRLAKMESENLDGIVLAAAGLKRLNLADRISTYFSYDQMVPACAQGCLALQIKEGAYIQKLLSTITDPLATLKMELERLFLLQVEGSCHIPVGAAAIIQDETVSFYAVLGDEDGKTLIQTHRTFPLDNATFEITTLAMNMKKRIDAHV